MILLEMAQVPTPEEGKVLYWGLGLLATALGFALAYVKAQHKAQIDAKDLVIKKMAETIDYERGEKNKEQEKYEALVKDFNEMLKVVAK